MMNVLTIIFNSIFLIIMVGVAGLFLSPYLPFDHGWELRIVESGSMEPAIMTGSLIAVRPQDTYVPGDVIMFDSRYAKVPTTHRILETYQENGRTWFVTMGDANEEADVAPVPRGDVIGTVAFDVPRVGFVLDFARQPLGFMLLIVLPALLIVVNEVEKIWREIRSRRQGPTGYRVPARHRPVRDTHRPQPPTQKPLPKPTSMPPTHRQVRMMDIATPAESFEWPTLDLRTMTPTPRKRRRGQWLVRTSAVTSVVVFSALVWSGLWLGSTVSYFNDIETSIENMLQAIALDTEVETDGSQFAFIGTGGVEENLTLTVAPASSSEPVSYDLTTDITAGAMALCNAIVVDVDVPFSYNGPLIVLTESDLTTTDPWSMQFFLPEATGLAGGETCVIDLVLTAWYEEDSGVGYVDEERVPLVFSYTDPNPVPDPAGNDSSVGGGGPTGEEIAEGGEEGAGTGSIGDDPEDGTNDVEPDPPSSGGGSGGGGIIGLSVPGPSAKPQPTVPELPAVDDQQAKEVTTEVFAVASDEPEPEPEPKEVGLDPDESSNEVVADETVDPTKSKPEVRDDEPSPAEPKPEETIGS